MTDFAQMMHMFNFAQSHGNSLKEELMPSLLRSIVTLEAGPAWHRQSSQFLGQTNIPGVPKIFESQLAALDDPRNEEKVQKQQESRA